MKTTTAHRVAALTGSALMLAGMGAGGGFASAGEAPATVSQEGVFQKVAADKGAVAKAPAVARTFAYSQGAPASIDTIARVMGTPRYARSSTYAGAPQSLNALDWTIEVGGAVENEFVATVGDLVENGPMNIVMGCSCASNPAHGVASADTDVSGVMFRSIVDAVNPDAGVNTAVLRFHGRLQPTLALGHLGQQPRFVRSVGPAISPWVAGPRTLARHGKKPRKSGCRPGLTAGNQTNQDARGLPVAENGMKPRKSGNLPGIWAGRLPSVS